MENGIRRFLIACLCSQWHTASWQQVESLVKQSDFNWQTVMQEAKAQKIQPLLYDILRDRTLLPVECELALRLANKYCGLRNTYFLNECRQVFAEFASQNVPVLALKGMAMIEYVYGNIALRPMTDVDIMVQRDNVLQTLSMLQEHGFDTVDVEEKAGWSLAYENEIRLFKRGSIEMPLELHWSLLDSPFYQKQLDIAWFWETAVPLPSFAANVYCLGNEAQLLHLCAHLVLHHSGNELLWLYDIVALLNKYRDEMDWAVVLQKAEAFCLLRPLQQLFPQLADQWQAPIPDHVLTRLQQMQPTATEQLIFTRLTAPSQPVAHRFMTDLIAIPNWSQRAQFALGHIFPAANYMQTRYHPRSNAFLPFYYPYRWLRGLQSIWQTHRS